MGKGASEDRKMESVYPVLESFFQSYLTERDLEKTLSFVSEHLYSIGTGEGEVAFNKEQFRELLRAEMETIPGAIGFRIMDYTENKTGDGSWKCFCNMETSVPQEEEGTAVHRRRLTALFRETGGRYIAEEIHMSEAGRVRGEEEVFPLRLSNRTAKMSELTQKELFELMFAVLPGGIIGGYLDDGFPLYVINDVMLRMMGYTYDEFIEATGGMVANSIYDDDVELVTDSVLSQLDEGKEYAIEYRVKKKGGGYFWVHDLGRKIVAEDGRPAIISILLDISDDMARRKKLEERSKIDYLTGVYNRRAGERKTVRRMQATDPYIYLMMDLDNFKQLNDTYGHSEGDNMLRYVGGMLKEAFRQTDVVARVGGDEFAVLACPCSDADAIRRKAEWIILNYRKEAERRYPKIRTSISIGGIWGQQARTFQELYELADRVLYDVKRTQKGQCIIKKVD